MAEFRFFDPFLEELMRMRLDETRFGVYLTNEEPSSAFATRNELAEIPIRNGYPGAMYLEHGMVRSDTQMKLTSDPVQFTAAGTVGFRAPVLFSDPDRLVGWWASEPVSLANGETFILGFDGLLGFTFDGGSET